MDHDDDAHAPRPARNAFVIFADEMTTKLRKQGVDLREASRRATQEWQKLSSAGQAEFQRRSQQEYGRLSKWFAGVRQHSVNALNRLTDMVKGEGEEDVDSVRQTSSKYANRPSPPYHAKDYAGQRKRGNDGHMYESRADRRGVYTWKPAAEDEEAMLTRKPNTALRGKSVRRRQNVDTESGR